MGDRLALGLLLSQMIRNDVTFAFRDRAVDDERRAGDDMLGQLEAFYAGWHPSHEFGAGPLEHRGVIVDRIGVVDRLQKRVVAPVHGPAVILHQFMQCHFVEHELQRLG